MNLRNCLAAALAAGAILAGCSAGSQVSAGISTTCTMESGQMTSSFVIHAPSEDAEITALDVKMFIPYDSIYLSSHAQSGSTPDPNDPQLREEIEKNAEDFRTLFSSNLDVDKDEILVDIGDSGVTLSWTMTAFEKFKDLSGIESGSLVYKDVLASLDDGRAHCE